MSASRLPQGGRIDRSRTLEFKWDNRKYQGYSGDTLASALMAGGETIFGRSFKYHRPRGIMSAGVEESGAIVTVGRGDQRDPNVKATTQEIYNGLVASGQNAWPNVRTDLGAVNGLMSRFFAAGFYYKTFMGIPPMEWGKGTGIWMKYEKLIRKAAGMGAASRLPDPDTYEHGHLFCDVLIVGSGPAGLAAAVAAAKAGLDVLLVEQDFEIGGDYLSQSSTEAEPKRLAAIKELEQAGARVMTRTTAFGLYDYGVAGLLERVTDHLSEAPAHTPRQRFLTVRAQHIILATGAMERMVAFGNNDMPGIMTASAANTYINRFGVLPGEKVLVATNNDSAYSPALSLVKAGADVTLLESRNSVPDNINGLMKTKGVEVKTANTALSAAGKKHIGSLDLANYTGGGWAAGETLDCDLLLVSGGWSPVVNLLSLIHI